MNWFNKLRTPQRSTHAPGVRNSFPPPSGGLALVRSKQGLGPLGEPIAQVPVPDQLVLPLLDYAKQIVDAKVRIGDKVQTGDELGGGVLASASGFVQAIEPRPIIHPSHATAPCVIIQVEHSTHSTDEEEPVLPPATTPGYACLERAGIKGLGGAGFATTQKIQAACEQHGQIELLLVNAVECEPDISCDEALIRSDPQAIINAVHAMADLTACRRCIIAIEDDKLDAVVQLREQLADLGKYDQHGLSIELAIVSAIYPSGAERVLVERITGQPLPPDSRAADQGIVCLNVATVLAAHRAQQGFPMISRVVSVTGANASAPMNVRVRFGTPVQHVLTHTGNLPAPQDRIRAGGPLSGFDLIQQAVPVTATTHCLAIEPALQKPSAVACIRCGACSDVCPVNLVPQQLYWYSRGDDLTGAKRFGLQSCIECGCCDVVCPSAIELTATFRYARTAVREEQHQQQQALLARQRYELHQQRKRQREHETQQARAQQKAQLASPDTAIAAALARSRARKKKI